MMALLVSAMLSGCNGGGFQVMEGDAGGPESGIDAVQAVSVFSEDFSSKGQTQLEKASSEDARWFTESCEAAARAKEERAALEASAKEMAVFSAGLEEYLAELEKAEADADSLEALLGEFENPETDMEEADGNLTEALSQLEEQLASIREDSEAALQAAAKAGSRETLARQIAALAAQETEKAQALYDGAVQERERAARLLEQLSERIGELQRQLEEAETAKEREEAERKTAELAAAASSTAALVPSDAVKAAPESAPASGTVKVIRVGDSDGTSVSANGYIRQEEAEAEMLRQINAYRKSLGLSSLTRDSVLDDCAAIRCEEMLDNDVFSHTRPNGTSWETVLTQKGVKASAWSEIQYRIRGKNAISSQDDLADHAVEGWKNSKGHDAIMRSSAYDKIGIGAYQDGDCWIANIVFIKG